MSRIKSGVKKMNSSRNIFLKTLQCTESVKVFSFYPRFELNKCTKILVTETLQQLPPQKNKTKQDKTKQNKDYLLYINIDIY